MSDKTVKQLKFELKELGVKGISKLKKADLIELLEKHGKINKRGTRRLDFTRGKNLKKTDKNEEILNIKPLKNNKDMDVILDKLLGYTRTNLSEIKSGDKVWIRYFVWNKDTKQYDFKSGGFLLTNKKNDNFTTFINPSSRFSWSVPRQVNGVDTIYFKSPDKSLKRYKFHPKVKSFFDLENIKSKRNMGYVYLNPQTGELKFFDNILFMASEIGSEIGIRNALRSKRNIYNKHFISRMFFDDFKELKEELKRNPLEKPDFRVPDLSFLN